MRRLVGGVAIVLAAAGCSSTGSTPVDRPPVAAPQPSAGYRPVTAADLLGRWKPAGAHGQSSPAYVEFSSDGSWSGSDGCNASRGTYIVGPGGTLTTTSGPTTLIGCQNSPIPSWVSQAGSAQINGARLVLFGRSGRRVGAMVKAAASTGR